MTRQPSANTWPDGSPSAWYAINPQSQLCKWIAIDADYDGAFFDLGKLKGELELDGVWAALEMPPLGGHLWILCEQPATDNNAQKNGHQEKARMKKARGKKKTQQKLTVLPALKSAVDSLSENGGIL